MVSVAGPYRKGKSYILSEAFDQPEVFPLGHKMVAETMGIWLWIVPEKYKVLQFKVKCLFVVLFCYILSIPAILTNYYLGFQRPGVHGGASGL